MYAMLTLHAYMYTVKLVYDDQWPDACYIEIISLRSNNVVHVGVWTLS